MAALKSFEGQQYLNIETFRKNGTGVKTPVWFAQDGEALLIWTEASSGKAKRIRSIEKVNIAPSKGDGTPIGDWVAATARADDYAGALEHVKGLMQKKYGWMFSAFSLMGRLRKNKYTAIRVEVKG
jgi:PPOX class probable F420-dependent enzyme